MTTLNDADDVERAALDWLSGLGQSREICIQEDQHEMARLHI